jgi:hypothetical protein
MPFKAHAMPSAVAYAQSLEAQPWTPKNLEAIDIIAADAGKYPPTMIARCAAKLGTSESELEGWIARITRSLRARPDALACLRHLADLRKARTGRWPCVQQSDVLRRRDALERAAALAAIMPVWPSLPLPPPNEFLEKASARAREPRARGPNGWERDEDGVARRVPHGPHKRQNRG